MGHAYNHGLVTSAKGATWEQIRFKCNDGSGTLVIDEDCGAGIISGITRNSQGNYTVQMSKPYPPKLIICDPQMSTASETTAALVCRYKTNSYDATAGTFVLFVSTSAGTAAADPANGQEIHVDFRHRRYTANP